MDVFSTDALISALALSAGDHKQHDARNTKKTDGQLRKGSSGQTKKSRSHRRRVNKKSPLVKKSKSKASVEGSRIQRKVRKSKKKTKKRRASASSDNDADDEGFDLMEFRSTYDTTVGRKGPKHERKMKKSRTQPFVQDGVMPEELAYQNSLKHVEWGSSSHSFRS